MDLGARLISFVILRRDKAAQVVAAATVMGESTTGVCLTRSRQLRQVTPALMENNILLAVIVAATAAAFRSVRYATVKLQE